MGKSEFRRQEPHRKPYPSICWPSSSAVVISSTLGGFWVEPNHPAAVLQDRRPRERGLKTPSFGRITQQVCPEIV